MANTFAEINKCLADYYSSMDDDTFYDDEEGIGKFLHFCTENGLEEGDLREEIEDNDAEDCMYLEFANDDYGANKFPFRTEIFDEQKQLEEMHKILKIIYETGESPKLIKEIVDFELDVTNKDTANATQLYKSQVYSMLGAVGLKDGALMEFFTIGMRNNDLSFLNSVVDTYTRDLIAASNEKEPKNFNVNDWVKHNTFLSKLHKKDEMKVSKFTSAVNSYTHRIVPKLQIKQIYKIQDNLEQISQYIAITSQVIQNIINEQKALPPFCADVIIAVKSSFEANDGSDLGDDDDEDDEEVDGGDEKSDKNVDQIGDLSNKLTANKCLFIQYEIDPNELKNTAPTTRKVVSKYNEFKLKLNASETWPRRRRFNIMVDRRASDDKKTDSMYMFEPPSDCNAMPNEQHVPEWYFSASRACMIPGEGYDNGKGAAIGSITKTNGQLITLSWHIEAADEIKCYLFYEGQSSRFYGQDILEVFPKLFDMSYGNNQKFIEGNEAVKVAKKIVVKDVKFETFYQSFGNDKEFPKYST